MFASPDDLKLGDGPEGRMIPFQDPVTPAPTAPPYLNPTNGVPFGPVLPG